MNLLAWAAVKVIQPSTSISSLLENWISNTKNNFSTLNIKINRGLIVYYK